MNDTPGVIEYGVSLAYERGADLTPFAKPSNGRRIFRGILTDLLPETRYHYRVIHVGDSRTGSFTTAPASGQPFEFVVLGDTRTGHDVHEEVVKQVLSLYDQEGPDLLFNTGDLVGNGGDPSEWDTFFEIEAPLLSEAVFHAVVGNHDRGEGNFYRYFSAHERNHDLGYYAFKYGNAHFTILSTETDCDRTSPQGRWLIKTLREADNDPVIVFKFVFIHEPGVTTGLAHSPAECVTGRKGLIDVFEETNVDIVWGGHIHNYEHTLLNGIHHVTSGCAGQGKASFDRKSIHTVYKAKIHGFSTVQVTPSSYKVDSYMVDLRNDRNPVIVDTWVSGPESGGVPGETPEEFLPNAGWGLMDAGPRLTMLSVILVSFISVGALVVRRVGRRRRKSKHL